MRELIGQELKKITKLDYLPLFLSLMIILTIMSSYIEIRDVNNYKQIDKEAYRQFFGPINQNEYDRVNEIYYQLSSKYMNIFENNGSIEDMIEYDERWKTGSDLEEMFYYKWAKEEYDRILEFKDRNIEILNEQEEKLLS